MAPTLSIVTITYRDPGGLETTMRSLQQLATTALEWEQVVVDSSPEQNIDALAMASWSPHHLVTPPKGVYPALNLGMQAAQKELVWFLNGGDALKDAGTLLALLRRFEERPSLDLVCAGADLMRDGEYRYPKLPARTLRQSVLGRNRLSHQAMIYRRSALLRVGAFATDFRIAADHQHHLRCLLSGLDTVCVPDRLVLSDTSGLSNDHERSLEESRRIAQEMWGMAPIATAAAHQLGFQWELARVRAVKKVSRSKLGSVLQPLWLRWNRRGS